jgi:hypothetical protein
MSYRRLGGIEGFGTGGFVEILGRGRQRFPALLRCRLRGRVGDLSVETRLSTCGEPALAIRQPS